MKVSLITVCYNSAKTIESTITSVLGQTYADIEYIIIDGKSTDDTLSIVNRYENRIAKVVSEKDNGIYDAINKGIQVSTGELVGILNADDFYIDNKVIEDVVAAVEKYQVDSLYADLYYVDAINTNKVIRNWKSGAYKRENFLYGWMPPHPTFFVKRMAYDNYGLFNLDLKSAADYELMLRFLYKNRLSSHYLNRPLVRMRVGGMSNASFKNRVKANLEDRKAWKINGMRPYPFTLLFKPLRKIKQYFRKKAL